MGEVRRYPRLPGNDKAMGLYGVLLSGGGGGVPRIRKTGLDYIERWVQDHIES